MRIILMRHGEASPGSPDSTRRLTPRGHRESYLVGERLKSALGKTVIWSSTYTRAIQTAEEVARAAGIPLAQLVQVEGITPDDDAAAFCESVLFNAFNAQGVTDLMVVTHMPFVGALRGLLVDGHVRHAQGFATSEAHLLTADVAALACFVAERSVLPN